MADTKISGLAAVTDLLSTDEFVLARSGTTKKIDAVDLFSYAPGGELDHVEFTGNVTVSATTEAGANTVVTSSSLTYDGSSAVLIEFSCPNITTAANGGVAVVLFQDGSAIGILAFCSAGSQQGNFPVRLSRRMTPSSGSHTYSIRCYRTTANGTVNAGAGGSATNMPGWIRITGA